MTSEAELPRGSREAIKIGADFPFGNGCGNNFWCSTSCPVCCFPQGLSEFILQVKVTAINKNWPTLVAEH
jgi:hypothetical protein